MQSRGCAHLIKSDHCFACGPGKLRVVLNIFGSISASSLMVVSTMLSQIHRFRTVSAGTRANRMGRYTGHNSTACFRGSCVLKLVLLCTRQVSGYFADLIDALKAKGYRESEDLFGAPYDFRLAADGLAQVLSSVASSSCVHAPWFPAHTAAPIDWIREFVGTLDRERETTHQHSVSAL